MQRRWAVLTLGVLLVVPRSAVADVWDTRADSDNTPDGTDNEMLHGTVQTHDVGALPGPLADDDWFRMVQQARSSYEAVLDGITGDIGPSPIFDRTDDSGVLIQSGNPTPGGTGFSLSLRWINALGTDMTNERIHVASSNCTTTCNAGDQYTIRYYETTYAIPRFNNSASQVTVLQLQNPTNYSVSVQIHFWSVSGTLLGTSTAALGAHSLLVLNTTTLGFAAGQSGSITVANTARYGDLAGKAVALEPATGFTFDTLMVPRAN